MVKKEIILKHLFHSIIGIFLGALCAFPVFADSIYFVQSATAKVMSQPSFQSEVIATLKRGDKFNAPKRLGNWIKITRNGKQGYVSALLVANHAPLNKLEVVRAEDVAINNGVRRRASSFSSAAAARGLTKEDRKRADEENKADYSAVTKMESTLVKEDEVTHFVESEKK